MSARFIVATVFDGLASLPDASVDLVLSSPPFLALRSYLPADHPTKRREIGSEPTPADFIDTLLDVVEASARVLAPHGSLVFELGDTYAGSGGAGGDYGADGLRTGQPKFDGSHSRSRPVSMSRDANREAAPPNRLRTRRQLAGWPMDKSMCGIPTLFAWSLAYGRNLLRPDRETDPWRIRNVVAWCRPNPPVGALGDKFRPATSFLTIATKSRTRFFDMDAVRSDPSLVKDQRARTTNGPKDGADPERVLAANYSQRVPSHPAGAPPLDWWEVATAPYAGSHHYATWPPSLLTRPILSMCPERVCRTCGEPSRRMVEPLVPPLGTGFTRSRSDPRGRTSAAVPEQKAGGNRTLGWTDCGHDDWRKGVVLDPFAGSGTTLAVATGHGRDAIGIDLDERNADLAQARVGMFLTVEHLECEVVA